MTPSITLVYAGAADVHFSAKQRTQCSYSAAMAIYTPPHKSQDPGNNLIFRVVGQLHMGIMDDDLEPWNVAACSYSSFISIGFINHAL